MNSRIAIAATVAAIAGTGLMPPKASAFCRMTTEGGTQIGDVPCTEEGAFLEWPEACLSYAIDERGSVWMEFDDVEQAVDTAFSTWQNQTCGGEPVDLIFKPLDSSTCQRAEFRSSGGNVNTIAFLDPFISQCGTEFARNAFAVTIVWHDPESGRIFDADMLVNDSLGPYALCPESGCPSGTVANPGPADLQSIITHEAGHFIGIGHSDVEEATMFASAARTDTTKRTLAADDIDAVCTIYPPGNLDSSCNADPFGGLQLDCEDGAPNCDDTSLPSSGGCAVGQAGSRSSGPAAMLVALTALAVLRRRRDARS